MTFEKKKKFIILDMDGTLIDSERIMLDCAKEYVRGCGLEHDDNLMLQFVGASPEDIVVILKTRYGRDFDAEGFLRGFVESYNKHLMDMPIPVKAGAKELLDYLTQKGWNMALATSTYRDMVEVSLKKSGLKKYFDIIISGDTVERSKPSPEIYLKTCAALGVKPQDCYAVEDSKVGVISAVTAGLKVLAVPDLHEVEVDLIPKCTGIFSDCYGIIEYLESI